LRGPLYPASLPAAASRAEKFDQLVLDALEPIEARWRDQLTKLDVAVDDVPEVRGQAAEQTDGVLHDGAVPLFPRVSTARECPPGHGSCSTAAPSKRAPKTRVNSPNWCTTCWSNRSPAISGSNPT
jgi:hypothetical protein